MNAVSCFVTVYMYECTIVNGMTSYQWIEVSFVSEYTCASFMQGHIIVIHTVYIQGKCERIHSIIYNVSFFKNIYVYVFILLFIPRTVAL